MPDDAGGSVSLWIAGWFLLCCHRNGGANRVGLFAIIEGFHTREFLAHFGLQLFLVLNSQ